ncbi:short chain dehydrogenase domain-containing protein [Sarocladium implicatum]|nr:short chain dehydrogenase domain-containing protein [Sarocladium implicatum]
MSRQIEQLRQLYPPKPAFTEEDLPDLSGKVYLVTGSNTGVGKELARMLYYKHGRVYVAARSEEKALQAIEDIKAAAPDSKGELVFLHLDLADLRTIKASANQFLSKESRLDVLFNNAGVMVPDPSSRTAQGYEMQLGVNNVGTFMFTELLTPLIVDTAKTAPENSVRVIWVASSAADAPTAPTNGVDMDNLDYSKDKSDMYKYMVSKGGNVLHSYEYSRRHASDGIVSVALNPGNLNSDLWRTQGWAASAFLKAVFLHPVKNGAYTELFAGLSPKVTMKHPGDWIVPWGRFAQLRPSLVKAAKPVSEGGNGTAEAFWKWCEDQVKAYL